MTSKDKDVKYPTAKELFGWVMTDHPGAEQFFEGFFKHYADLGVKSCVWTSSLGMRME